MFNWMSYFQVSRNNHIISSFLKFLGRNPDDDGLLKRTDGKKLLDTFIKELFVENGSGFLPWPMKDTLEACELRTLSAGMGRGRFEDITVADCFEKD